MIQGRAFVIHATPITVWIGIEEVLNNATTISIDEGHCIIRMDPAKLKRVKTQGSRSITIPSGSILGRLLQIKQLFFHEKDDPFY